LQERVATARPGCGGPWRERALSLRWQNIAPIIPWQCARRIRPLFRVFLPHRKNIRIRRSGPAVRRKLEKCGLPPIVLLL